MLTTEPGPDVAPYHSRQIALLPPDAWQGWLDHSLAATDCLRPAQAGTLAIHAAPRAD